MMSPAFIRRNKATFPWLTWEKPPLTAARTWSRLATPIQWFCCITSANANLAGLNTLVRAVAGHHDSEIVIESIIPGR